MVNRQSGSDPRFLRRHYPHQVQGVVRFPDLSAFAAPPLSLGQDKTRWQQVNCPHNGHKGREGAQLPNDVVPFVDFV